MLRLEPRGGTGRKQAILYRQNEMPETQCSLFPIDCTIPKLDAEGSNPFSRSIFSIAYGKVNFSGNPLFEVTGWPDVQNRLKIMALID